jgi:cell division protein FtsN
LWNLTGDNATSKPGRSLLPVLTILFLVSYGLLTMLVVEQGRTIDSQRNLIHLLFGDSVQLSSMNGKAIQKQQAEARAQSQKKSPSSQTTPSDPQAQSPSTHRPQAGAKNQSTSKAGRPLPQKPPKDTSDQGDDRRTLISI